MFSGRYLLHSDRLSASARDFELLDSLRADFFAGRDIDESLVQEEVLRTWKRSKRGQSYPPPDLPELPGARPLGNSAFPHEKARLLACLQTITRRAHQYEQPVLANLGIATFDLAEISGDIIAYSHAGSKDTLADLERIGLGIGTNFNEQTLGPNVVSEVVATGKPFWFMGSENYLAPLTKYAIFAQMSRQDASSINRLNFVQLYVVPLQNVSEDALRIVELAVGNKRVTTEQGLLPQMNIRDKAFESFLRRNEIAVVILNKRDTIIDVSSCSKSILGFTYEEACGYKCAEAIPELHDLFVKPGPERRQRMIVSFPQKTALETSFEFEPVFVDGAYFGAIIYATDASKTKKNSSAVLDSKAHFTFSDILGNNPSFVQVRETAMRAARTESNVLLCGENGTGKELFAHAIHNASLRRNKPFIVVNCRGLFDATVDSTLFGNVERVFSADQKSESIGKLEQANGGTIFFNNIDELPLYTQTVLGNVLRTRTVTRMGSDIGRPLDIRVIASASADLFSKVQSGSFRSDLYYFLNIIRIDMIPLRNRIDDVPCIAKVYTQFLDKALGKRITGITHETMAHLKTYSWPGNVRELQNVLERCVDLEIGEKITCRFLPEEILRSESKADREAVEGTAPSLHSRSEQSAMPASYTEAEARMIKELMVRHRGNKSKVAHELGISRNTLYRKLERIDDWA